MINQSANPQFERNHNDICLLYVVYFSLLTLGERRRRRRRSSHFPLFLSPVSLRRSPISGWLHDWSDCSRRGWQNVCFIPPPPPAPPPRLLPAGHEHGSRAPRSPQTYGPMSVPGRVQKGLRSGCFKCLRVGGGTPLHFQALARRPAPVAAQTSQYELPVWPSGLLLWP